MTVWRPWDADDDEYERRSLVREMIPGPLRTPILAWVRRGMRPSGAYSYVDMQIVHGLQTALQTDFRISGRYVDVDQVVGFISRQGDQFLSRVVDFLLNEYVRDSVRGAPHDVLELKAHLDNSASILDVVEVSNSYRLRRRIIDGLEELAEESRSSTGTIAGNHLGRAWSEAYSLSPNTSVVMTEAIRAVEAAAHPLVTPEDKQRRLGKITQTIKDQSGWSLVFSRRDDNHPDHRSVLIGMLETLILAQADRHGGGAPTVVEAQGHVQLASVLVQWFSTGVVRNLERP